MAGKPTTAASEILRDHVPTGDAHVVEALRGAGGIVIGKLNLHEFAYGALTTSPHFGPARNPWAPDRVCGGSSGGSGAAAAADPPRPRSAPTRAARSASPVLLRRDGATAHGGARLERGRLPRLHDLRHGRADRAHRQDCALLLDAIAGTETRLEGGGRSTRRGGGGAARSRRARDRGRGAGSGLRARALGALVEPVEVPLLEEAGTIQQLVMLPEATTVHLPWLRTRLADYGADVRARLLAGLFLPATAYGHRAAGAAVEITDETAALRSLRPARRAHHADRGPAHRRGDGGSCGRKPPTA